MLTKIKTVTPNLKALEINKNTTNNVEKCCNLYYIKTMSYIAKFRIISITEISGFSRVILQKCSACQIPVKTRKIQKCNLCSLPNDTD